MTLSRRALYAAGETFGESATRRELGRIVCGGGDSESSQATHNIDKRNAVQNGIGLSGDGSSVTTYSTTILTDAGMTGKALDANNAFGARALDSIDKSTALTAGQFDKLLQAAENLWQRGETLVGQTQKHVADAYLTANTDARGAIDNKTIIVLAVAGAAVAGAVAMRRK